MLLGRLLVGLAGGFSLIGQAGGDRISKPGYGHISGSPRFNSSIKLDGEPYETFKCKTEQALNFLDHPDDPRFPKQPGGLLSVRDLEMNGWVRYEEVVTLSDQFPWLPPLLQRLGQPVNDQSVTLVEWDHYNDWTNAQGQHGAGYHNIYAPHLGMIIVNYAFSPEYQIRREGLDTIPPEKSRWSDVTWVEWFKQCSSANVDPSSLQFIFHDNVVNMETMGLAQEILDERGQAPAGFQVSS